jgi:2',3'-cyclic-nucleotide 2'-phosphodiesterase (5'-nucleotidase family)
MRIAARFVPILLAAALLATAVSDLCAGSPATAAQSGGAASPLASGVGVPPEGLAPADGEPAQGRRGVATVLILHTNDLASAFPPGQDGRGGVARLGGFMEQLRRSRKELLYLNAGDAVTGTAVSSVFLGSPVFHILNALGCDAMTLGNHEFDHGFAQIAQYREIASFPILCANARGPDGQLLADLPYQIFDVDGVRIGVIGVTTEGVPSMISAGLANGCVFEPPASAVSKLLPEVRANADLVVVLSHLGLAEDKSLASLLPDIDVIVEDRNPLTEPCLVGDTIIVRAAQRGRTLGWLDLTVDLDRGRVTKHTSRQIPIDASLPVSQKVQAAVEVWERRLRDRIKVSIGELDRAHDVQELESLIAEICREVLRTDLGFQNPGGTRAALAAGTVTIGDVWSVLPFENTLATVWVRGADLPDWAQRRLGKVAPRRQYSIGTSSFVADHPKQFFPSGVVRVERGNLAMRDAVIEWIRKRHGIPELPQATEVPQE